MFSIVDKKHEYPLNDPIEAKQFLYSYVLFLNKKTDYTGTNQERKHKVGDGKNNFVRSFIHFNIHPKSLAEKQVRGLHRCTLGTGKYNILFSV